jgi:hypothetical protein
MHPHPFTSIPISRPAHLVRFTSLLLSRLIHLPDFTSIQPLTPPIHRYAFAFFMSPQWIRLDPLTSIPSPRPIRLMPLNPLSSFASAIRLDLVISLHPFSPRSRHVSQPIHLDSFLSLTSTHASQSVHLDPCLDPDLSTFIPSPHESHAVPLSFSDGNGHTPRPIPGVRRRSPLIPSQSPSPSRFD